MCTYDLVKVRPIFRNQTSIPETVRTYHKNYHGNVNGMQIFPYEDAGNFSQFALLIWFSIQKKIKMNWTIFGISTQKSTFTVLQKWGHANVLGGRPLTLSSRYLNRPYLIIKMAKRSDNLESHLCFPNFSKKTNEKMKKFDLLLLWYIKSYLFRSFFGRI